MPPEESFQQFWSNYPKRVARKEAWKAWLKLKPDAELLDRILTALDWQVRQPDWTKANRQYMPYPASYLNAERWTDEPPCLVQADHVETHTEWRNRILAEARTDRLTH